jgi:hypothetical protein
MLTESNKRSVKKSGSFTSLIAGIMIGFGLATMIPPFSMLLSFVMRAAFSVRVPQFPSPEFLHRNGIYVSDESANFVVALLIVGLAIVLAGIILGIAGRRGASNSN